MKGGIFLTRERKNSKYGHFIKLTFEDENEFDEYISTLENLKTTYKTDLEFLELVEILDHIIDTMKKKKNTKYNDELSTIIPEEDAVLLFDLFYRFSLILAFGK